MSPLQGRRSLNTAIRNEEKEWRTHLNGLNGLGLLKQDRHAVGYDCIIDPRGRSMVGLFHLERNG